MKKNKKDVKLVTLLNGVEIFQVELREKNYWVGRKDGKDIRATIATGKVEDFVRLVKVLDR